MTTNDHILGIRVGAACNQAAEVLSGAWRLLSDATLTSDQLIEIHLELAEGFFKNASTIEAASGIAQAFPGTTQVAPQVAPQGFQPQQQQQQAPAPFAPANVVQAPFGQQAPQQAPAAPGTGTSKADQEWQQLFNNPQGFYDNRQDKRNPNGPDFKAKDGSVSLWLNGKYGPAPQWVFDRLQGGFGPVQ